MKIHNNIKFLREEKGLTQKVLAEKAGVSERNLQSIESGLQDPKISTLFKLSRTLNKTIDELFQLPSTDSSSSS